MLARLLRSVVKARKHERARAGNLKRGFHTRPAGATCHRARMLTDSARFVIKAQRRLSWLYGEVGGAHRSFSGNPSSMA